MRRHNGGKWHASSPPGGKTGGNKQRAHLRKVPRNRVFLEPHTQAGTLANLVRELPPKLTSLDTEVVEC